MTYMSQTAEQYTPWAQAAKVNNSIKTSISGVCGMELAVVESCFKLQCLDGNSVAMDGNPGNGDIPFPSVYQLKHGNVMTFHSEDSLVTQGVNAMFCSREKPKLSDDTTERSTHSLADQPYWNNSSPENHEPIPHVCGKSGYEDEAVAVKQENVIVSSPLATAQSSTPPISGDKLTCSQQSSLKSTGHLSGVNDMELQCTAMVYPPFGNSSDVAHFVKKEDVLLDVRGNHNQGIASSMGWAGHHSLVHFDSLKVVPELLVERIRQEDSIIRDVFQNGGNYQIGSHKSICASSTSAGTFHGHWGISSSCGVKSYGGSSNLKQSGSFCDFSNTIQSAIRQNCKPQNESSKTAQFMNSEQNVALKQTSNFGRNMNSNFMCRTMFLMNDNLQNNSRVHAKNIFSAPTESGSFIDPKCNFDSNAFCCGSNGLVFADKHVAAKHQLTACGALQPPVPVDCGDATKRVAPGCVPQQGVPTDPPSDQRPAEDGRGVSAKDKCPAKPKERPFSCEECGKSFLLKHHLTTHTRVHTGERPYICSECGKSFAHKHCLVTHQRLHTGERPYTCLECKKSFTLKHHLVTHTRVHSRDRPFACEECGRTFSQKRHLVTHAKLHTGERPFACEECGESFSQKEHLTTHSRFHGGERPYVCPDCGNAFQRKFQLVSHARLHGKRPYSCQLCGKEFLQKRTLVAHTRLHTGERPFACQHCGEAFGRKCELAVHSRAAHTSGGRSFACRECGNCFASREGLALHLRLHAGERSLVTDLCGLAFPVDRGNPAMSRVQGIGMVPGTMVDGRVGTASGVAPENRCVTTGQSPSLPHKPHLCIQCGKSFAQKHGLVQHTKRHSGEKPHACNKCGKTFAQKYSLSLHSRLHPPTDDPAPPRPAAASPPSIQHSSPTTLLHSSPPAIQHSSPPAIQHSSPPAIQHSSPPAIQHSSPPAIQHSSPPAIQLSSPPTIQHSSPPNPPHTPTGDAPL